MRDRSPWGATSIMSDHQSIIGDTSILTRKVLPFNAVHSITLSTTSTTVVGHATLSSMNGFRQLIRSKAHVTIRSSSLRCQVVADVDATKTAHATLGVIPSTETTFPSSASDILTIGGSSICSHSLVVGSVPVPLGFGVEVAHQIKPQPIVGEAPEVVYSVSLLGGAAGDVVIIRVSGEVEVEGAGFVSTW